MFYTKKFLEKFSSGLYVNDEYKTSIVYENSYLDLINNLKNINKDKKSKKDIITHSLVGQFFEQIINHCVVAKTSNCNRWKIKNNDFILMQPNIDHSGKQGRAICDGLYDTDDEIIAISSKIKEFFKNKTTTISITSADIHGAILTAQNFRDKYSYPDKMIKIVVLTNQSFDARSIYNYCSNYIKDNVKFEFITLSDKDDFTIKTPNAVQYSLSRIYMQTQEIIKNYDYNIQNLYIAKTRQRKITFGYTQNQKIEEAVAMLNKYNECLLNATCRTGKTLMAFEILNRIMGDKWRGKVIIFTSSKPSMFVDINNEILSINNETNIVNQVDDMSEFKYKKNMLNVLVVSTETNTKYKKTKLNESFSIREILLNPKFQKIYKRADYIIYDECHEGLTKSKKYNDSKLKKINTIKKLYLSGTPYKEEYKNIPQVRLHFEDIYKNLADNKEFGRFENIPIITHYIPEYDDESMMELSMTEMINNEVNLSCIINNIMDIISKGFDMRNIKAEMNSKYNNIFKNALDIVKPHNILIRVNNKKEQDIFYKALINYIKETDNPLFKTKKGKIFKDKVIVEKFNSTICKDVVNKANNLFNNKEYDYKVIIIVGQLITGVTLPKLDLTIDASDSCSIQQSIQFKMRSANIKDLEKRYVIHMDLNAHRHKFISGEMLINGYEEDCISYILSNMSFIKFNSETPNKFYNRMVNEPVSWKSVDISNNIMECKHYYIEKSNMTDFCFTPKISDFIDYDISKINKDLIKYFSSISTNNRDNNNNGKFLYIDDKDVQSNKTKIIEDKEETVKLNDSIANIIRLYNVSNFIYLEIVYNLTGKFIKYNEFEKYSEIIAKKLGRSKKSFEKNMFGYLNPYINSFKEAHNLIHKVLKYSPTKSAQIIEYASYVINKEKNRPFNERSYRSIYMMVINAVKNFGEVFTPNWLVNDMLDMFPADFWKKPHTVIDPTCGSGNFLVSAFERFMKSLTSIPNRKERAMYIVDNLLYGIEIQEKNIDLCKSSLYECIKKVYDETNSEVSIVNRNNKIYITDGDNEIELKHIRCEDTLKSDFFNIQFDAIVGNPPYQKMAGTQKKSIFHYFIDKSLKNNSKYFSFIVPGRWMTYSSDVISPKWIKEKIQCNHFKELHYFEKSKDCFSTVKIPGSIVYFLYDKDYNDKCNYYYHNTIVEHRYDFLDYNGDGKFIKSNIGIDILNKVKNVENDFKSFNLMVAPKHFFDNDDLLGSNWKGYSKQQTNEYNIKYYASQKTHGTDDLFVSLNQVPKHKEYISKNKIFVAKIGPNDSVIQKPFISGTQSVCSYTYIYVGYDKDYTDEQLENILSYMKTKFFRYLVSFKKSSVDCSRKVYELVPIQNFDECWTDEKLYERYSLSEDEIDSINKTIKSMD